MSLNLYKGICQESKVQLMKTGSVSKQNNMFYFSFLAVLAFELKTLSKLGRCFTI
jgi:hypothetical protein